MAQYCSTAAPRNPRVPQNM